MAAVYTADVFGRSISFVFVCTCKSFDSSFGDIETVSSMIDDCSMFPNRYFLAENIRNFNFNFENLLIACWMFLWNARSCLRIYIVGWGSFIVRNFLKSEAIVASCDCNNEKLGIVCLAALTSRRKIDHMTVYVYVWVYKVRIKTEVLRAETNRDSTILPMTKSNKIPPKTMIKTCMRMLYDCSSSFCSIIRFVELSFIYFF